MTGGGRDRRDWWAAGAVAVVVVVLYGYFLNPVPDYRADQAQDAFTYLSLGRSLAEDGTYPTRHWHPGFPVLIALALGIGGASFAWLKAVMVVIGLLGVAAAAVFFSRLGLGRSAPWLALLLGVTPLYFDYAHRLMSEVPFVLCVTAALALALPRTDGVRSGGVARAAALAAFGVAAVLLRGNGLALVPALAAAAVVAHARGQGAWRAPALGAALTLMAFAGWMAWGMNRTFQGIDNVSYLQEVRAAELSALWAAGGLDDTVPTVSAGGMVRRIYQNVVWHQGYHAAALYWPGAEALRDVGAGTAGRLAAFVLVPALLPALFGLVVLARRSPVVTTYLVVGGIVIILYPTGGAERMLLPLAPMLLAAFHLGVERMLGRRTAHTLLIGLVVAQLAVTAFDARQQARTPYAEPWVADAVVLLTEDVPRLTAADAVVLAPFPQMTTALGRRTSVPPTRMPEGDAMPDAVIELVSAPLALPASWTRVELARRGDVRLSRLAAGDVPPPYADAR